MIVMRTFVSQVYAQEEEFGADAGDISFVPQISYQQISPEEGDDMEMLFAMTGIGYYLSRQFELSGVISVVGTGKSFTDYWFIGLMPTLYFHLGFSGHQRVVPHLGAGAGVVLFESGDDSESGYQYSGLVGLDWWVVKDAAVRIDLKYIRNSFDDFETDTIGLFIGANLVFD